MSWSSIKSRIEALPPAWWLLPAALALLWPLALHPAGVLFSARSGFTDLLVSHWPNALWLRRALFEYGELPLWNPAILDGQPFAADPLAGMWYPPNWLLLLPGVPLAYLFNLLFLAHMLWGGWGMFRLLRGGEWITSLSSGAALVGAIACMGMPKWAGHLAAGHVSLCFAVAWTPWLLNAVLRAARTGRLRDAAQTSGVFALLFLADPRWAAYAGLLAAAYALRVRWVMPRSERRAWIAPAALFVLLFIALSAALWLPLLEFQSLSARAALTPQETAAFSLPPRYLAGLLLPDVGGFHEWLTYLGLLPLLLAAISVLGGSFGSRFWSGVALVAALFSLGTATPLFGLAQAVIPSLGWLRVPPRAWFLVGVAVSILAAQGAERLAQALPPMPGRRFRLAGFAAAALAWGLAVGAWVIIGAAPTGLLLLALSLSLALALVALRGAGRLSGGRFLALAALAVTLDLALVNGTLMRTEAVQAAFGPGDAAAQALIANAAGSDFRVYSPSYSLPQHVAARYGLEQADGVNPLQLDSTVDFMSAATGVPRAEYSVTLPPLANGDAATANSSAVPDAALLGLLNVRYVAAEFDVAAPGLAPVATFGSTRLYENTLARPRAWVVFAAQAAPSRAAALAQAGRTAVEGGAELDGPEGWIPAQVTERGVNFLTVEAVTEQPGLLVLAEVDYPGWRAWVDGQPAPIARVDGLLRGVLIPAGRHAVRFQFVPGTVYAGAAASALAWLALALLTLRPPGWRQW